YYMMDPGNTGRGGVAAFAPPVTLTIGNKWRLVGAIQEFFGETEFSNIIDAADLGAGSIPSPVNITVADAARDTCDFSQVLNGGEDHEGAFVKLLHVKPVQRFNPPPTNGFHVADQSFPDTIFVENFNSVLNPFVAPPLGHVMTITGVLHYSGGSFRVIPRSTADIVDEGLAGVGGRDGSLAFSVYPNPARTARLSFTLPKDEDVEIGIYDVAGRQVASIVKGNLAAGSYSRQWSGEDANGRKVGAGVFFARIKAGGVTKAIRTVYLGQ